MTYVSTPATPALASANNIPSASTGSGAGLQKSKVLADSAQILQQLDALCVGVSVMDRVYALFKYIAATEQKAPDADATCTDLLERINLMLSQFPELEDMPLTPAGDANQMTIQIVQRIVETLQTSACLLHAFRQQGPVARRVNGAEYNKHFQKSADAIQQWTEDLITAFSLPQTGQADALSRPIPEDATVDAERAFIERHGGADKLRRNPALMADFARVCQLPLDDRALAQVNARIDDLLFLSRSEMMSAMSAGTREVGNKRAAVRDMKHTCVHCGRQFQEITNTSPSCAIHKCDNPTRAVGSTQATYACCGGSYPCTRVKHSRKHHSEFPYEKFFPHARKVLQGMEPILAAEDRDLQRDALQEAQVGRVRSLDGTGPALLVRVGELKYYLPYFLETYTPAELRTTAKNIARGRRGPTIFRSSEGEEEFAMAEWVMVPGQPAIDGVRITVKASTSAEPKVAFCHIDSETCTRRTASAAVPTASALPPVNARATDEQVAAAGAIPVSSAPCSGVTKEELGAVARLGADLSRALAELSKATAEVAKATTVFQQAAEVLQGKV